MPKPRKIPTYRLHRPTGQAVVSLDGKDHYLGTHGSDLSRQRYVRLVEEWVTKTTFEESPERPVSDVVVHFWRHAKIRYGRTGRGRFGDAIAWRPPLRLLRKHYGKTPVSAFGPKALRRLMHEMEALGWTRTHINRTAQRIKHIFKWAASEELVPATVYHRLVTLAGLRRGDTEAPETKPVKPVDDSTVDATLPHLPEVPAAMVRFQRLTGARPQEVCILRPCDVDRSRDVWVYTPEFHKTQHHDLNRRIYIGPRAQEILTPYLLRAADAYCFDPRDSEKKRRAAQHAARKTPASCGNRPGTNRKASPKRTAKDRYTTDSYRRAIHRACRKAKVTLWSPNQLRHTAGTAVRAEFGLEAVQSILGHTHMRTSEIYAEKDERRAVEVARRIG